MFIEVNRLRGLIIDIDSFEASTDSDWKELIPTVKCLFLSRWDNRISRIHNLHPKAEIRKITSLIGFFAASQTINLRSFETSFVTANIDNLISALDFHIGTIFVTKNPLTYDEASKMPDFRVTEISKMVDIVNGKNGGYFSEAESTIPKMDSSKKYKIIEIPSANFGSIDFNIISGGRYFGTQNVRSKGHQLSARIIKNKNEDSQTDLFYRIYLRLIRHCNKARRVDGIAMIPPRPEIEYRDKFRAIIDKICIETNLTNFCDSLRCIKSYPSQKSLNLAERKANVKGIFRAKENVKGKSLILIDDVISSGATANECIETLFRSGIREATVVVLGINQFESQWRSNNYVPLQCGRCGGEMRLRFNGQSNEGFFGCANYSNKSCKHSISFNKGLSIINMKNDAFRQASSLEQCDF
jgi:hypothetical protein